MQRRRIYENAIVLSPKPFKAYFEVYRNEYPEDGMRVLTLEELEDRLLLRLSPTGETYVRKHSSSKEEAEAKIAALRRMKPGHRYRCSYLSALESMFDYLFQKRWLLPPKKALEAIKGHPIVISGYVPEKGIAIAQVIQELPNLALCWDSPLPIREDVPPSKAYAKKGEYRKAIALEANKVKADGEEFLRFGGDFPSSMDGSPARPFYLSPIQKGVYLGVEGTVFRKGTIGGPLQDEEARKELGMLSLAQEEAIFFAEREALLRNPNLTACLFLEPMNLLDFSCLA